MRYSWKINSPRKSPGTHQFVTFHQSPKLHGLSTHRSTLTAQHFVSNWASTTLTFLESSRTKCTVLSEPGSKAKTAAIKDPELQLPSHKPLFEFMTSSTTAICP